MRRPSDQELEESLRRDGCLHPILRFGGVVFDGARRLQVCALFGLHTPFRDCSSHAQLLRMLWLCEPERAIAEAGKLKITEYAETFQTSQLAVAAVLRGQRPAEKPKRLIRIPAKVDVGDRRERQVHFWLSHRLRYLMALASHLTGRSHSEYLRQALQDAVSRDVEPATIRSLERGRLLDRSDRPKKKAKQ